MNGSRAPGEVLHAVVLPVVADEPLLPGESPLLRQREAAGRALAESARRAGAELDRLESDERGAPLPSNGWHWSISHSVSRAAAVVWRAPVGIDLEHKQPRRREVMQRVLNAREAELLEGPERLVFLRAWTAKEAVLKKLGVGLAGLSDCRIVEVHGPDRLLLDARGARHAVWQAHTPDRHVLSLSADALAGSPWDLEVEWVGADPGSQEAPR